MRTLLSILFGFLCTTLVAQSFFATDLSTNPKTRKIDGILQFNDGSTLSSGSSINTFRVSPVGGNFTSLHEAFAIFDTMSTRTDGIRLIVDAGTYVMDSTESINYGFPISIEGGGINITTLEVGSGLHVGGVSYPMFDVYTDIHFHGLYFDGSTVPDWKTHSGGRFACHTGVTSPYIELKDFNMYSAYTGICMTKTMDIYAFDFIIEDCVNGIGVGMSDKGGSIDFEIANFVGCENAINLVYADSIDVFFNALRFFDNDTCVNYHPTTFVDYRGFTIANCNWDRMGIDLWGFDFTNIRDANIEIENNIGISDNKPFAKINVADNASTTTITTAETFYKAVFTNGTTYTNKFTLADNKATMQSGYTYDVSIFLSGNAKVNANNKTVTVAIKENNTTLYSPMNIRCATSNQAYPYTLIAVINDVSVGDYYEIFVTSSTDGNEVILEDIQWIIE